MSCDELDLTVNLNKIKAINSEIKNEMIKIRSFLPKHYSNLKDKVKKKNDLQTYLDHIRTIEKLRTNLKNEINNIIVCDKNIDTSNISKQFSGVTFTYTNATQDMAGICKPGENKLDNTDKSIKGCDYSICQVYENNQCKKKSETSFLNKHIIPYPFGEAIIFPIVIIILIISIISYLAINNDMKNKNNILIV